MRDTTLSKNTLKNLRLRGFFNLKICEYLSLISSDGGVYGKASEGSLFIVITIAIPLVLNLSNLEELPQDRIDTHTHY